MSDVEEARLLAPGHPRVSAGQTLLVSEGRHDRRVRRRISGAVGAPAVTGRGSVGGGAGGVGAAGGEGPAEEARLGLLGLPAGGLLRAVVGAALGAEVALVGGALRVGRGVVEVGVDGLGLAAGGGAGAGAGADQVPELAAGGVAVLGVPVVAGPVGDRLEGDVEAAQRPASCAAWRASGRSGGGGWRWGGGGSVPGALRETRDVARGAAVGGGGAVGAEDGDAPAGLGVAGGGADDVLVSRGFRSPQPLAWEGAVSQPEGPAWTRRLMTAGIGARTGACGRARRGLVVVAGVFVKAGIVAGMGPDADGGVSVPARTRARPSVLALG